jgi:ribosomal protein S13
MASIPLALEELEAIAEIVSRELLEQWAIDDRFTEEQMTEAALNAVDDTIFVINRFMEQFNSIMMEKARESKII